MAAVADHQATAALVTLIDELRDVGVDLGLQRLGQHPAGALPDDLINQRHPAARVTSARSRSDGAGTTVSIRVCLPSRRANVGQLENLLSDPGRVHPFPVIHRFQALLLGPVALVQRPERVVTVPVRLLSPAAACRRIPSGVM
jgi:hypothetical protein